MSSVARSAYEQLVRVTPLVRAPQLADHWTSLARHPPSEQSPLGPPRHADVRLKLESLQRTGSFKLRGACTRLDALDAAERTRGVVAASAGNHGLGVALAGRTLGIGVTVVVPATSPQVKRLGMAALGARVVDGGPTYDDAEAAARALAVATGAVFVSPFDDVHVIAGNGTRLGEEVLAQEPDVAMVVCPVGGGGLIGGLAAALVPRGVAVVGVQPATNCAMHDSLARGAALTVYPGAPTLAEGCDGAVAERTYLMCREHRVSVAIIEERAIRPAMAYAYRELGVMVEPTAAVGLAGLLTAAVTPAREGATVVIVSGGNVDPDLLDSVLRNPQ